MRHPVRGDRVEDRCRFDAAQTDMRAGDRGDAPGIGPAVAVEHRQGPEIDRMPVEPERDRVAERVQIGAAMVKHDAFRVAGRARGVVQRDRAPFVLGRRPCRRRGRPPRENPRIRRRPTSAPPSAPAISTSGRSLAVFAQRLGRQRGEFAVGDQQLRPAMLEDERDRARVEPVIQRVQDRAGHRHGVMRFKQRRHVRRQHRHRVAAPDAAPAQRVGKAANAVVKLTIRETPLAAIICASAFAGAGSMTASLSG